MPNYRAQIVLNTQDNVAANYVTNTWYFNADSDAVLTTIESPLITVYNGFRPDLSNLLRGTNHQIKWYDMLDSEPRAPVRETNWDFSTAPTGAPLPPEVSLTVSFQGERVSGLPQARRRGRIFVGPLSTSILKNDGRVADARLTNFNNVMDTFLTASKAATTWRWQIFSRTSDGFIDVDNGWVDNEFDTQRRRGRPYTSRLVYS